MYSANDMEMIQAEEIPGMIFRGRKVFLEQLPRDGESKTPLRQDCKDLSFAIRRTLEKSRQMQNQGLIIRPGRFRN